MSRRASHAYRPLSIKRRAWLTLGAVVLGGGGIVSYAAASPFAGHGGHGPDVRSKRPAKVYDLALKSTGRGKRELPRTETKQFSLLGVSWKDADKELDGRVQVRTRDAGTGDWTGWRDLETGVDPVEVPEGESEARGASEPLWVGPSDGVEVQVVHADGSTAAGLPTGFEVNLIDPGVTAAEARTEPAAYELSPAALSAGAAAGLPAAAADAAPQPPVVARADWGADESISPEAPDYNADVKAVFVHHTAGSNDYTCADSAAIVRGVYAYHVKTNGWKDIGYNFLVDKCGTVFEGRKGGIDQPVLGAHTYGWNRESAGIAVLGDYSTTGAPEATLDAVARVAAWKLGLYGLDPASTVQLTAGATQTNYMKRSFTTGSLYTFDRISGHRDGFNSECPGTSLYGQLPAVRALAGGPVEGLKVTSMSGAGLSGQTYYTKGKVTVRWSAETPASLIGGFDVLVDGEVAASTDGSATSAAVTLAAGSHTVAVRATHLSGRSATTAPLTVVAETTAPTFTTTPKLSLRGGTVNTGAVPVTLNWKAADNAALRYVKLLSPYSSTYGPASTVSYRTAKSGTATAWSMRAYDYAGNSRTSSPSYTPVILQETSAAKTGKWTSRSSGSYLGGKSYSSSAKGASLTWSFTGRSAAWVVSRASGSGQAYVYVDGKKTATVDLKSSAVKYRQAIWTKTWPSSARHSVKIVVVGTKGRPTVTTDGLVHLK